MAQEFKFAEAYAQLELRGQSEFGRKVDGSRRGLERLSGSMNTMAMHSRRMMLAGGAVLGLAIRQAAIFEQSMSRVLALSGATSTEFAALSAQARLLGATTQFSASQSASAMASFALAGFDAGKIMASMAPTLDLAAAGQLGVGQAAEISAKIMAGMKLEASELTYAVDVLAKAFTTAQTDLPMLGEAMKYVGPVAKTANKSLEEVVASIMVLSNVGIQAAMAGTSLRGILSRLAKDGRETKAVFRELGIETKLQSGYLRPLADIVDDFSAALEQQGRQADATGLAMLAFGDRAGPAFAALLSEGGDAIRDYEKSLKAAGGTAKRIAEVQLDNLSGSVVRLKSAVEALAETIGTIFKDDLRGAADELTKAAGDMAAMDDETKRSIATWTKFAAIVGGGTIAVAAMTKGLLALGAGSAMAGAPVIAMLAELAVVLEGARRYANLPMATRQPGTPRRSGTGLLMEQVGDVWSEMGVTSKNARLSLGPAGLVAGAIAGSDEIDPQEQRRALKRHQNVMRTVAAAEEAAEKGDWEEVGKQLRLLNNQLPKLTKAIDRKLIEPRAKALAKEYEEEYGGEGAKFEREHPGLFPDQKRYGELFKLIHENRDWASWLIHPEMEQRKREAEFAKLPFTEKVQWAQKAVDWQQKAREAFPGKEGWQAENLMAAREEEQRQQVAREQREKDRKMLAQRWRDEEEFVQKQQREEEWNRFIRDQDIEQQAEKDIKRTRGFGATQLEQLSKRPGVGGALGFAQVQDYMQQAVSRYEAETLRIQKGIADDVKAIRAKADEAKKEPVAWGA